MMDNHKVLDIIRKTFPHDWLTPDRIQYLALVGSRGFNLHTDKSDWDFVGVAMPPRKLLYGLNNWEVFHHVGDEVDIRLYSPRKFGKLLATGSPNPLEMLYVKPLLCTMRFRSAFGYAPDTYACPGTIHSIISHATSTLKRFRSPANSKLGDKRRQLVDTFGYDTSAAMHSLRWLNFGSTLLLGGHVEVGGENPEFRNLLMEVKLGKYTADEVEILITESLDDLKELEATTTKTYTPDAVRLQRIDQGILYLTEEYLRDVLV